MTLIIAEAGVNHNGDESLAFELVKAAYEAGADIVKFQTFKAKNLVTEHAQQAEYQAKNSQRKETQLAMLSRLELPYEAHHRLLSYCQSLGIEFLSTAFDEESLTFLVKDIGLKRLKIPSGELTNAPLVLAHARSGCELIVSTGMATLAEVEMALQVIAFGLTCGPQAPPSQAAFMSAYLSSEGQQALRNKVILLHCTTEYPAAIEDVNLRAMDTLHNAFGLPIGYSDHTSGITVPVAAVARGAGVIEKHFTISQNLPGPDHKASLEPQELKAMVEGIRLVESALGSPLKAPSPAELKNKVIARKSLVAIQPIKVGESFTENNIGTKRPGNGKSPYLYWDTIGRQAQREYKLGDIILD